eukprot:918147_1
MSKTKKKVSRCDFMKDNVMILFFMMIFTLTVRNFFTIARILDDSQSKSSMMTSDIMVDDVIRYKITNFTLCDIRYSSRIYLGSHHKTGTMLLNYQLSRRTIAPYIKEQCPSTDNRTKSTIFESNYHLDADAIDYWLQDTVHKIHRRMKRTNAPNQPSSHVVILNIIRHPLDTIISAYNYHVTGPERWTRVPLHQITKLKQKYQEEKESACTAELFLNLTRELG